jgi:CrcB protein
MNFYTLVLVGSGGFLGSVARYIAVKSLDEKVNSFIPYGTLAVNIIGSFILGVVYAFLARKAGATDHLKLLLGTGFCGGFTTYSAFAFENVNLLQQKLLSLSVLYMLLTLTLGFLAVFAGVSLGKYLSSSAF